MEVDKILARYEAALAEWERRLDGYTPERFARPPAPGEWSAAEVYDHVRAVQETCLAEMRRCLRGEGERGRSGLGPALFSWMGSFPPVRIRVRKIPPGLEAVYRPRAPAKDEAAAALAAMRAEMRSAAAEVRGAPPEPRTRHWAGGWFNAAQWFHSAEMHLRHHFRQLHRLDRRLPAGGA